MKKLIAVGLISAGLGALSMHAYAEKQGHMQAAQKNLEQALDQLQKATSDKGGHRAKAMEHTRRAMDEVKLGIDFDNKH